MLQWNWKYEFCLLLTGLLVGGPLGTQFYKTLKKSVSSNGSPTSYHYFRDSDTPSSTLALLVPGSFWFLVTTSLVGGFFWLLGELLSKLRSASRTTSMEAASRRADGGGGGGRDAQLPHEQHGEQAGEGGGGLILEGHDNMLLIHQLVLRGLILLPHGRLRLWGIAFL